MNDKIISLYEHYKNTPKKLKIVCGWDEVIQACEPWALWKALGEKEIRGCQMILVPFDSETQGQTKVDLSDNTRTFISKGEWIKENASDFDLVIDDNPEICRSLVGGIFFPERHNCEWVCESCPKAEIKVFAPHYPAIKHDERVLLVENKVSNLKKEDFVSEINTVSKEL